VSGGGIVPELSARQHIRDICGVVRGACDGAGIAGVEAIAVTQGPGLVGSLLVGPVVREVAGVGETVPLVPVHHLAGHIESLVLENGEMPLPAVVLVGVGWPYEPLSGDAAWSLRTAGPHPG
jgi:N6-L-threonylcarbamoyladenine synthase